MESRILIAYATRSGSTRETAQAMADAIREDGSGKGIEVELLSIASADSLARYNAVIVVAALYMGRLHKDARRFLSTHCDTLSLKPVALFVPGPADSGEKSWAGARQQLATELARMPWFSPAVCEVIGGVWQPQRMSFPWNVLLRNFPGGDARDWNAIRRMACDFAERVVPVMRE